MDNKKNYLSRYDPLKGNDHNGIMVSYGRLTRFCWCMRYLDLQSDGFLLAICSRVIDWPGYGSVQWDKISGESGGWNIGQFRDLGWSPSGVSAKSFAIYISNGRGHNQQWSVELGLVALWELLYADDLALMAETLGEVELMFGE